jgi:hypothetical protein
LRKRAVLRLLAETEAVEDAGGAGGRGVRADVDEARLDLGDALGIAGALGLVDRAARSASAASTKSISVSSPPGASCSMLPSRAPLGAKIEPASGESSPRMRRKRVVLPAPLRPTRPTRDPLGSAAVAPSIRRRSPRR